MTRLQLAGIVRMWPTGPVTRDGWDVAGIVVAFAVALAVAWGVI